MIITIDYYYWLLTILLDSNYCYSNNRFKMRMVHASNQQMGRNRDGLASNSAAIALQVR